MIEAATVINVDLNQEVGDQPVKQLREHQPESMFIQVYLANHDKLGDIVKQVTDKYGKLNILVNNYGAMGRGKSRILSREIPMRRLGEVESDIGRVVVFLASGDSDYITGQTIMVNYMHNDEVVIEGCVQ